MGPKILGKINSLRQWRREGTIKITKKFREDDFETLLNQMEKDLEGKFIPVNEVEVQLHITNLSDIKKYLPIRGSRLMTEIDMVINFLKNLELKIDDSSEIFNIENQPGKD